MNPRLRTPTSNKQALQDIPSGVPFQFYFGGPEVFEALDQYREASKGAVFRAYKQVGVFDSDGEIWAVNPLVANRFERPGREVIVLEKDEYGNPMEVEVPKASKVSR